jgi:hypothetical protein
MSYDMHLSSERTVCTLLVFKQGKRKTMCLVRKAIFTDDTGCIYLHIYTFIYLYIYLVM